MGRKWIPAEVEAIAEVRRRVSKELLHAVPYPEVVGDRRILRFLRGKQMDIGEAALNYRDFLSWRKKFDIDTIRQEIVYGGRNSPFFFPKGKEIIDLAPQIIVTPFSLDRNGRPLCLEQYCFSPKEVLKVVTREQYLLFLIYALEYRALVMEQMSYEADINYESTHLNEEDREDGYGTVLMDYTIRDLKGVGFAHLGSDGRSILKAALDLGLPNYPEYLGKCHMVNTPSFFNTLWYFVKGLLDEPTQAKFEFSGSNYLTALQKDIALEYIPACLGGGFDLYNEPYAFDTSPTGPFFYLGSDEDVQEFLATHKMFVFDGLPTPSNALATDGQQPAVGSAQHERLSWIGIEASKQNMMHRSLPSPQAQQQATAVNNTSTSKWLQSFLDTALSIIKFWYDFFVYNWQHQRVMLVIFLIAAISLLLTRPVVFQALILCICVSCIIV